MKRERPKSVSLMRGSDWGGSEAKTAAKSASVGRVSMGFEASRMSGHQPRCHQKRSGDSVLTLKLDISMDDPASMQKARSPSQLGEYPPDQDLSSGFRTANDRAPLWVLDHVKQLATIHPLKRQAVVPLGLEVVDERDNIWVRKTGENTDFPQE